MVWKKIKLITLLMFLSVILLACNKTTDGGISYLPVQDDCLQVQLESDINSIDPAYVHSNEEIMLSRLIFQGLVTRDVTGELIPALASNWQISPDGKLYTFYLREDVYFHNGAKMTADDCKFSIERALRLNVPNSYIFYNIVGYNDVVRGKDKNLAGIQLVDDYTLTIQLVNEQKSFLSLLASPGAYVLNRKELVEHGVNFAKAGSTNTVYAAPSGTGPYCFIEWIDNKLFVAGINENYYGEKPNLKRMEFAFNINQEDGSICLYGGETDVLYDYLIPKDDVTFEGIDVLAVSDDVRVFNYAAMNEKIAPFNNLKLRQAIINTMQGNIGEAVRPNYYRYSPEGLTDLWFGGKGEKDSSYDIDTSLALLEEAGFPQGVGLGPLTLYCGDNQEQLHIAESITENLTNLGLTVKIDARPAKEIRKLARQGELGFYILEFADNGGGIDNFFYDAVDARFQKTIQEGPWTPLLAQAENSENNDSKKQLLITAEQQLREAGVLTCLYQDILSSYVNEKWQAPIINHQGFLLLEEMKYKQ